MKRVATETAIDERRESTRFALPPDTYFAVLNLSDGRSLLGEVSDESLGGLGLLLREDISLKQGDEVELIYLGQILQGEVCHIHRLDEEGLVQVGFSCQPIAP